MHLICYLCIAKENFAAFFFFTPRSIKLWSTETQENTISSHAESQLRNPSQVKKRHSWKSLLPGNWGGFHHISTAAWTLETCSHKCVQSKPALLCLWLVEQDCSGFSPL